MKKEENQNCIQCGYTKSEIKKQKYFCVTMTSNESGNEVDGEWDRHRFRPYSEKELKAIASDEKEMVKQMGEMAKEFSTNN